MKHRIVFVFCYYVQWTYLIVLLLRVSFPLHSQETVSMDIANSARIPIIRSLSENEAIEFKYSFDTQLVSGQYNIGLEILFQCVDTSNNNVSKRYVVRLQDATHRLYWHAIQFSCLLNSTYSSIQVSVVYLDDNAKIIGNVPSNIVALQSLALKVQIKNIPRIAIPSSLYDMMHWSTMFAQHQDYTVFRWQQYPKVLIFFFKDKQVQARYLKRIAFFVEKRLTRGSIMYDEQIAHRKGWGAHNYKMESIARFFELGRTQNFSQLDINSNVFPFHREELDLKQLLIEQGFLQVSDTDRDYLSTIKNQDKEHYSRLANMPTISFNNYMVSIAVTYSEDIIRALLSHELLHSFYFDDADIRNVVARLWQTLNSKEQKIWRHFFAQNGYDENYGYLVKNEFFAYLLQRPIKFLSWYLEIRIIPESGIVLDTNTKTSFIDKMEDIAYALQKYMQQKYSIQAGDLMYVKSD